MEITKDEGRENLGKLIEKYEREKIQGNIKAYQEAQNKNTFIEPFLKDVLGWDTSDRNEVSLEQKVSKDKVDYGLGINDRTRIFLEAGKI